MVFDLRKAKISSEGENGEIPGSKIGDSWRFELEEDLKLIEGSHKGRGTDKRISL